MSERTINNTESPRYQVINLTKIQDKKAIVIAMAAVVVLTAVFAGCLGGEQGGKPKLIQTGSSTVLPLAIAWAEEFDGADIDVSGGGSSHGLNSLLNGDVDFGDASRLMKASDYEKVGCPGTDVNADGTAKAACNGVTPTKWVVAFDVLSVVINNDNSWAGQLNYSQLYKIFTNDNPAIYWDEVPGLASAPHERVEIYAPDEASGTYDFFFEEIIDDWGKDTQVANPRLESAEDPPVYHPSADDNVILNAIKDNKYAIGYFGFAYYKDNTDKVQAVWIADGESNYEEPSLANVANYPMARPLHIYTDGVPDEGNIINDYLRYILGDGQDLVTSVGYVNLALVDQALLASQLAKL